MEAEDNWTSTPLSSDFFRSFEFFDLLYLKANISPTKKETISLIQIGSALNLIGDATINLFDWPKSPLGPSSKTSASNARKPFKIKNSLYGKIFRRLLYLSPDFYLNQNLE